MNQPQHDHAAQRHHAKARAARAAARQDLALGLGVVAAALAALAVAFCGLTLHGLPEMLLRVHVAGLVGLFGAIWGLARVEAAAALLAEAGRVRRAIEAGEPAWLDPRLVGE